MIEITKSFLSFFSVLGFKELEFPVKPYRPVGSHELHMDAHVHYSDNDFKSKNKK